MKIDAKSIIELLATKHSNDVFIPECKGGPTQGVEHDRMDAWAMKCSWSRPLVTVYEVKVSRSDFLGDDKWQRYLDYCNELYFVCPTGMIAPDELPPEAGLMYVAKTGTRLFTKKKAQRRQVVVPEELYRYVLMSRVVLKPEHQPHADQTLTWARWLRRARQKRRIGKRVAAMKYELNRRLVRENEALRDRIGRLCEIRARIRELGFSPDDPIHTWQITRKLDDLRGEVPAWGRRALDDAERSIARIKELIDGEGAA